MSVVHDPVSADAEEFPESYCPEPPDIVLSFGLLYHLANPVQHLRNLLAITKRHAVVYTMTHYRPFAKDMWSLAVENASWITKATSSISWTPHFLEVDRLCRDIGFRRVNRCYPERFRRNFPEMTSGYSRATDIRLAAQMLIHRLTGARYGHLRNHRFEFFQQWLEPELRRVRLREMTAAATNSRHFGDDYWAGCIFRDHGFIGGQTWHYYGVDRIAAVGASP